MQKDSRGQANDPLAMLQAYFQNNALLLCNENACLPYLGLVGGDWDAVVQLMERGDVFYSKFFQKRVTYLSREFYYALKPHRRRMDRLSVKARNILAFLDDCGGANAETIQAACMLDKKAYTAAMDELFFELLVTVSGRDRTLNVTWCSFLYETSDRWEQKQPKNGAQPSLDKAADMLCGIFTKKQINALLR
jgi:hypothetical protein